MSSTTPKKVAVITTSTRAIRVGPHVSNFVHKTISTSPNPDIILSAIDLATFNLPIYNEKVIPAMGQSFEFEPSKAWSAAIASYDAYIIVSPEYNYGVPGSTKNAIDYLYHEWIGKPVLIVTYGVHGGTKASDGLKETLTGMKLRVVETRPQLAFADMADVGVAMTTGGLAENSAKFWEKQREPLIKGFEELVEALNTPVKEAVKDPVKEQAGGPEA